MAVLQSDLGSIPLDMCTERGWVTTRWAIGFSIATLSKRKGDNYPISNPSSFLPAQSSGAARNIQSIISNAYRTWPNCLGVSSDIRDWQLRQLYRLCNGIFRGPYVMAHSVATANHLYWCKFNRVQTACMSGCSYKSWSSFVIEAIGGFRIWKVKRFSQFKTDATNITKLTLQYI